MDIADLLVSLKSDIVEIESNEWEDIRVNSIVNWNLPGDK